VPDLVVPAVEAAGPPIAAAADATVSSTVPLGSIEPPAIGGVPLGTHAPSGDAPVAEPGCPAVAPGGRGAAVGGATSSSGTGGDGADTFSFAGPVGIPVTLDGGAGDDSLLGPSGDTTWTVDGPGSGLVEGIRFANFENLQGAPANEDTFVLEQSGSLAGTFDGGAGGFDSLVLDGSWHTMGSAPADGHSGTLTLDGQRVTYAGLEP